VKIRKVKDPAYPGKVFITPDFTIEEHKEKEEMNKNIR